ncbi:hypothetical protein EJ04DRAFT_514514 [Polyplosphaeria fusca]|uniref:Nuclear pore complex protein Nup85 n=1 Tax=Polyplosphaeria fusca TaxID=682080 RepID=A0A9P4QVA8_9PLEO|nr:hypothetical protein EJ04DRAFT_514514 [Polyplosphaeria fusca]
MFRLPSPSPPSTPGYRRSSRNVPSTTPAGPPPDSSFPSSTPAGPPPSAGLFGANSLRAPVFTRPALGSSPPKNNGELFGLGSGSYGTSTSGRPGSQRGRSFRVPSSSSDDEDDEGDEYEGAEAEYSDDAEMHEGQDDGQDAEEEEEDDSDAEVDTRDVVPVRSGRLSQSLASRTSDIGNHVPGAKLVHSGAKQSQHDLLALAKGLSRGTGSQSLPEPPEIILETERLMDQLHESQLSDTLEKRDDVLAEIAQQLVSLWKGAYQSSAPADLFESRTYGSKGKFTDANRLVNLLLQIRYPSSIGQDARPSSFSLVPTSSNARHFKPIPKILLDYLDTYHTTVSEVEAVFNHPRGYSAHPQFWDAIHFSVLRGNFTATLRLLKHARLEAAATSKDDNLGHAGYGGAHLVHANNAVSAAIRLLHECPAVNADNWDVKGQDWALFRRHVQQTVDELHDYSEGDSRSRHDLSHSFQPSHFGMSQSQQFSLSVASRKAESKVPWSVYEGLHRLYRFLMGDEDEIITLAADWFEAALLLTAWWNGDDEDDAQGSLAASRRSVARSQRLRPVDATPIQAYCQRLSAALDAACNIGDEKPVMNANDSFEVGLACICDDNIEGVLHVLRSLSLSLAAAVAEIATAGEWFRKEAGILDQFDQSDLMVLSYNEEHPAALTKDDILREYATALAKHETFVDLEENSREGWELAIQVLGRMSDRSTAGDRIESIIDTLPLQSARRVDKITRLCNGLGLSDQARKVALKFADHLRHNTQEYGDVLVYYARAHDAMKVQEVLRVLVAHCLVKSIAYPPHDELDDMLHSLITCPKQTLTQEAQTDPEAARILSTYLSGYATIRKFYDTRDEEILCAEGEKPKHRPMERKKIAGAALMVIIQSAASSLRGGRYDPKVETVIQVDVLLTLLGEALVFVNQEKRTLSMKNIYALMSAVENIDTAPPLIRAQAEECLRTTLAAAHDAPVPSPDSLLQKSTSNLTTASSQYSLIGSQDLPSTDGQSTESSTVLVKGGSVDDARRAWDWRKGFKDSATGKDIIRVLRLGLAKESARAFAGGEFK